MAIKVQPDKWLFLKPAALLLGLLVLFASCKRGGIKVVPDYGDRENLQSIADSGILLNSVEIQDENYVFHFENEDYTLPKSEVSNIVRDSVLWKTKIVFTDYTNIVIPSKGGSLAPFIERIQVNPSGYSPLSALVDVHLPTYGRIRVTVKGKHGAQGDISHLCHTLTPRQQVPIFGLYPDYKNKVELTYTDKEGNKRGAILLTIQTKALDNPNVPKIQVLKSEPDKLEPGVNLVNYPGASILDVSMPYMVDKEGEIRWILFFKKSPDLGNVSFSLGLKRMKDGNFIAGDQNQQRVVVFDMFGNLVKQWDLKHLGYSFHHDITVASNGNFLITVTKNSARLTNGRPRVMDHIIELDPQGGTVVHEWDLANMIDTSRYFGPDGETPPGLAQSPTNWAHNNSIIEFGKDILATMRYQGIISFDYPGHLRWIISPHKYWGKKYQPYLLQPVDESGKKITDSAVILGDKSIDGFDWPWGPHTPVALSDDRFIVFDNGYNRHWIPNMLQPEQNYSRVVEYQVNEKEGTVQQLWSYGKSRRQSCFSEALSGVQYLPSTGHILFFPGMGVSTQQGTGGRVVEIDPHTNKELFDMEITVSSNIAFYRVTRMPLYPDNI